MMHSDIAMYMFQPFFTFITKIYVFLIQFYNKYVKFNDNIHRIEKVYLFFDEDEKTNDDTNDENVNEYETTSKNIHDSLLTNLKFETKSSQPLDGNISDITSNFKSLFYDIGNIDCNFYDFLCYKNEKDEYYFPEDYKFGNENFKHNMRLEVRYVLNSNAYRIVYSTHHNKKVVFPPYEIQDEQIACGPKRTVIEATLTDTRNNNTTNVLRRIKKYMGYLNDFGNKHKYFLNKEWLFPFVEKEDKQYFKCNIEDSFGDSHEFSLNDKSILKWSNKFHI